MPCSVMRERDLECSATSSAARARAAQLISPVAVEKQRASLLFGARHNAAARRGALWADGKAALVSSKSAPKFDSLTLTPFSVAPISPTPPCPHFD